MERVKKVWIFGLVLFGIFATLTALAAPPAEQVTNIIKFAPAQPGQTVKEGNCWTGSIAVARPDAWRCMVGNEIMDPCFASSDGKLVVCNPNPAKGDPGFSLKLTEPLPKSDVPAASVAKESKSGWLIELADGTICRPVTGASGKIKGKVANYYCESRQQGTDIVLLGGIDTTKPLWITEKATTFQSPKGPKLIKSEKMAVKTVWR